MKVEIFKESTATKIKIAFDKDFPVNGFFQVLKSESVFGPYDELTEFIPVTKTEVEVDDPEFLKSNQVFFYKIKIKNLEQEKIYPEEIDQAYSIGYPTDTFTKVLAREHLICLKNFGVSGIYFPIRTRGNYCMNCVDTITKSRTKLNCEICLNTGLQDPLLNGIKLFCIFRMPDSVTIQHPQLSGTQSEFTQVELPYLVRPKEGDYLVLENGNRFKILAPINFFYKRNSIIWSMTRAVLLPIEDIFYKINIDKNNFSEIKIGLRYAV